MSNRVERILKHLTPKEVGTSCISVPDAYNDIMDTVQRTMLHQHIYLGHQFQLFKILASKPMTSSELAQSSGTNTRVMEEWCNLMTTNNILSFKDGKYILKSGYKEVLTDINQPYFNSFTRANLSSRIDALKRWYETGIGPGYDDEEIDEAMRLENNFAMENFTVDVLAGMDKNLPSKLSSGIHVAEIGCGQGKLIYEFAKRFPQSKCQGFDIAEQAIHAAVKLYKAPNLSYTTQNFLHTNERFDLILIHDMIHDSTDPLSILKCAHARLSDNGSCIIVDTKGEDTQEAKLKSPLAPLFFAFSMTMCLPSSMSEPNGAALGTMAMGPETGKKLLREAGFGHIRVEHSEQLPINIIFVAKK